MTQETDLDIEEMNESSLEERVARDFAERGYCVCRGCTSTPPIDCEECPYESGRKEGQRGIDLVARKEKETWIIECKGVRPSGNHTMAFYEAIAQTVLNMKVVNSTVRYAIALPGATRYLSLLEKLSRSEARRILNIHVLLLERARKGLIISDINLDNYSYGDFIYRRFKLRWIR